MTRHASAKYYRKKNRKDFKKSRERYQKLSEEKKNKKREYGHEQDKNISEDEKQKLVEYRKRYYEMQKNLKCSLRFQFLAIRVKMG